MGIRHGDSNPACMVQKVMQLSRKSILRLLYPAVDQSEKLSTITEHELSDQLASIGETVSEKCARELSDVSNCAAN